MPKWRALHPYRPYRAARTFVSSVARDRTEGTGGKVEPHAHDKNADDDDDRDGPIIVQEGPSSGALDTTLEKKKKEQEAAADEKRKSQITEAEEDEHVVVLVRALVGARVDRPSHGEATPRPKKLSCSPAVYSSAADRPARREARRHRGVASSASTRSQLWVFAAA